MVRKTSSFLVGRNAMLGCSLGNPAADELPESKMTWGGHTGTTSTGDLASGNQNWPTGALANFNRLTSLVGRRLDSVRAYSDGANAWGTTGINGSAGAYGLITPDQRSIANTGTALCITTKLGGADQWVAQTNDLTAAGSNTTKTNVANIAQNIRRWVNDNGNTAPIKKLLFGWHHEPSNDTGATGPHYVAWWHALVDEMAANGIGDGPDPGGHSGFSWIDCIEWTFVDIGTTFTTGGNPYYPGSAYVTWVMADPYNWAGGSYCPQQKTGQVPQLGDNVCTSMWGPNNSHYNQAWSTFKDTVQHILDWSDNNPDPLLGLGEFSTSHLIDRWTINTRNAQNVLIDPGHAEGVLITPVTATAQPLAAGEWYKNVTRVLQGLNHLSGTSAVNQFTADPRGTRLKLIHGWNSQEKAPRWINGAAFATGDTTGPTTTGSTRSSMLTGWVTMANDTFWDAGAPPPTDPPSGAAITALVDPGDSMTWNFTGSVTQGTGSITGYDWSFGAGGGTSTLQNPSCTYTTPGIKNITFTVTDSNSLSASATRTITVIDPGGGGGGSGGGGAMAGYQYIRPGGLDQYVDFRLIYNPNLDKTEVVFAALAARLDALEGGGGGGGGSVVGTPVLGTLVEDAAVTTTNVPYPAGITANQLLVAFMSHGAITTATNPSGWTQVYNSVRGALQPALWVGIKTATGTESGSLAVVHPSAVAMGRMMRVPNVNVANPQDATATTIQVATASTTTVLPTLATNHAGTLLVAIAAQNSGTANASTCASTGATWTEDADRNTGTRAATMWHSARGASGGTGDVTITWSGAATSHGVLIALRPV